jgi:hypothetical protein
MTSQEIFHLDGSSSIDMFMDASTAMGTTSTEPVRATHLPPFELIRKILLSSQFYGIPSVLRVGKFVSS